MERSYIFIGGIVITLLLAGGIVATVWNSTRQPTPQEDRGISGYNTFSSPNNIFESLRSKNETPPSVIATTTTETFEDTQALSQIIRAWEERAGSSDARQARAQIQVERTPQEKERDEISVLFNDLVGPRITDYETSQNSYSSLSNDDLLWGGTYDSSVTAQTETKKTPTQVALHSYTNKLGALLQSFNLSQGDQAGLLEDFLDTKDTRRLQQLTDGYIALSAEIAKLEAPAPVVSMHNGMIISYTSVGELLWEVGESNSDEELLDRMLIYNTAAEDVARHHVAFITTLKAHGVTFQSHEPGNIFTFSPTAGRGL